MKTKFLLSLMLLGLSACASTGKNINNNDADRIDAILTAAQQVNTVSGIILDGAGPLAVTGICVAQPPHCAAAKAALTLAHGTHDEITRLISAADAAHAAPDGTQLVTLGEKFAAEMGNINTLVAAYGGMPVDITTYRSVLTRLQTGTSPTPD